MERQKNTAPAKAGRWRLRDILKRQPPMAWIALLVSVIVLILTITRP